MPSPPDIYETRPLLDEYLLFHYGTAEEILPPPGDEAPAWRAALATGLDFPLRTVGYFSGPAGGRALDLGCAVGRSAFELSAYCDEVIGIDFSHAFIRAAETLGGGGTLPYQRHEEGHLHADLAARAPAHARPERLRFEQGDAMNLRPDLGEFDRVHAANLLCRLAEPLRLLDRLPGLVKPGGQLLLATPCTWLAEFTPPANWPAGETFAWLRQRLEPSFTLVRSAREPFLIRETARKFQFSLSQISLWERTA
jgi:putative 4-mercaptohistidine N1-methyltranferase